MREEDICEYLDWDSEFFGVRIGRAVDETLDESRVGEILNWCLCNRIDCLYFLAAADSYTTTRVAEQNGFELMDIRVLFGQSVDSMRMQACTHNLRTATEDDIETTAAIARNIHKGGRFHFDPRLSHKADDLYGVWIANSIRGFADAVFVCDIGSSVAGYVTCKVNEDGTGQIGLVGVDSEHQGLGIGRDLVAKAVEWLNARGCPKVLVVTQGRNIAAQVLYQKCGFVTVSVKYWYHRWR